MERVDRKRGSARPVARSCVDVLSRPAMPCTCHRARLSSRDMSIAALVQGTSSRSAADAQRAAFSYPKSRFETDDRIRACTWQSFKERPNWNVLPCSQWRLFPGHPRLKTGESLNSWFSRLAHANGLSELSLTEMIFSVARAPKIDWDTLFSDSALACLAFCGGVADLQSHSLGYSLPRSPSSYWPNLIDEFVVMRFSGRSRATQVCLDCLADDRIFPGGHFKLYQAWPLQNVPARA